MKFNTLQYATLWSKTNRQLYLIAPKELLLIYKQHRFNIPDVWRPLLKTLKVNNNYLKKYGRKKAEFTINTYILKLEQDEKKLESFSDKINIKRISDYLLSYEEQDIDNQLFIDKLFSQLPQDTVTQTIVQLYFKQNKKVQYITTHLNYKEQKSIYNKIKKILEQIYQNLQELPIKGGELT